eukprot:1053185-Rhodomonas_salina.1
MLEQVWDLPACTCQAFTDNMLETIKKQLLWPELVTVTLPAILGEEFGTTLEATGYTCDNVNSLEITLVEREVEDPRTCRYKLRLLDGAILGSSINLLDLAFMFSQRDPTALAPYYALDAQVHWAEKLARVPEIKQNIRAIDQS